MQGYLATIARPQRSESIETFNCRQLLTSPGRSEGISTAWRQDYAGYSGTGLMQDLAFSEKVVRRFWPLLADLSTELIMLILEQLLEMDPRAAASTRQVCRRLNHIATPLVYRAVSLNRTVVSKEAAATHPQALGNISRYTTHVTIPSDLDPYWVKRVLDRMERLQEVTWRYVRINRWEQYSWRPCHVLDMDMVRKKRLRLRIEDLPVDVCGADLRKLYIQSIPPDMLVSLKLGIPTAPLSTQVQALKELLLQARNLETFHYRDSGQGTHFTLSGTERLPPFRDLRLECYDWNHTTDEVAMHWDFSRLRSLELVSMPTYPFLASVPFAALADLHSLKVEDFSLHHTYRREEATTLLHTLVRSHIRALHTLDLRVHMPLFPVNDDHSNEAAGGGGGVLHRHVGTLRTLRLRDHTGFGDENVRVPTLSPADLAAPADSLARLGTLELDMDVVHHSAHAGHPPSPHGADAFLGRLACGFVGLHTLTLHVHTLVDPLQRDVDDDDNKEDGYCPLGRAAAAARDRDAEFAYWIFAFLVNARSVIAGAAQWRRIEVNVGGWQRVGMLRRLGESWKRLNASGVYGERCFVLERVEAGGGGGYRTGEEFGGGLFLGSGLGGRAGEGGGYWSVDEGSRWD